MTIKYTVLSPENVDADIESMEKCITEIRSWMQRLHLKMNDCKIEYIYYLEHRKCNNKLLISVILASMHLVVRNPGVVFDKHMCHAAR